MDVGKISSGVSKLIDFMNGNMSNYDPVERIATLNSTAFTIQSCILAEGIKATMLESMRRIFDPKKE